MIKMKLTLYKIKESLRERASREVLALGILLFGIQIIFMVALRSNELIPLIALELISSLIWVAFIILRWRHAFLFGANIIPSIAALPVSGSNLQENPSLNAVRKAIQDFPWDILMRNAQDGGANSALVCRILEKTVQTLQEKSKQVQLMVEAANAMKFDSAQLNKISVDIKALSEQARLVSTKPSSNAEKKKTQADAVPATPTDMENLYAIIAKMATPISAELANVAEKITESSKTCIEVSAVFGAITYEVTQFKNLMLRVEELATLQEKHLKNLEVKLKKPVN
ncbi:MAG: hypothetical protein ABIQ95_16775 [Bdellovibrionia bacterium]